MEPFSRAMRHANVGHEGFLRSAAPLPDTSGSFDHLYATQRLPMVRLAHIVVGSERDS